MCVLGEILVVGILLFKIEGKCEEIVNKELDMKVLIVSLKVFESVIDVKIIIESIFNMFI